MLSCGRTARVSNYETTSGVRALPNRPQVHGLTSGYQAIITFIDRGYCSICKQDLPIVIPIVAVNHARYSSNGKSYHELFLMDAAGPLALNQVGIAEGVQFSLHFL